MLRLLTYMGVLLVLPLALLACGSDDDGGGEEASGQQVDVSATEFRFNPADLKLDAAGTYIFHLTNAGEFEHALEIDGQGIEEETSVIGGGESADVTVDLAEGEYEIYCPVGNHREMGMEGTLVVGAGGAGAGTGSDTTDDNTKTDDDTGTEDDAMGY